MTNKRNYPKIAIDGPAGAGKSTVSRKVAEKLALKYLDTGAMYRAITLKLLRNKINLTDLDNVSDLVAGTSIKLSDNGKVFMDNEDVTAEIRESHVNRMVSEVSAISLVRQRLVEMQRDIAKESQGIVMEGRDIASRVMPDADYKIYLDASVNERVKRRCKEQVAKGIKLSAEEVALEINKRDRIDSQREDSPLKKMPDAIMIDTTDMNIDDVVNYISSLIEEGHLRMEER